MQTIVKQPLTPLQLELLKLFARDISDADLFEIKRLLVKFFAEKAMDLADETWENNNWLLKDEIKFLNEHNRTPYKHRKK